MFPKLKLPSAEEIAAAGQQLYERASQLIDNAETVSSAPQTSPVPVTKPIPDPNRSLYVEAPAAAADGTVRGKGVTGVYFKLFEPVKTHKLDIRKVPQTPLSPAVLEKKRLTAKALEAMSYVTPRLLKKCLDRWIGACSDEEYKMHADAWKEIFNKAGVAPKSDFQFSRVDTDDSFSYFNAKKIVEFRILNDISALQVENPSQKIETNRQKSKAEETLDKALSYAKYGLEVFCITSKHAASLEKIQAETLKNIKTAKATAYPQEYEDGAFMVLEKLKGKLGDPSLEDKLEKLFSSFYYGEMASYLHQIHSSFSHLNIESRGNSLKKLVEELYVDKNILVIPILSELSRSEYGPELQTWAMNYPDFPGHLRNSFAYAVKNPQFVFMLMAWGGISAASRVQGPLKKVFAFFAGAATVEATHKSAGEILDASDKTIQNLSEGKIAQAAGTMVKGLDKAIFEFPYNFVASISDLGAGLEKFFIEADKTVSSTSSISSSIAKTLFGTAIGIARDWTHAIFKIPSDFNHDGLVGILGGLAGRGLVSPLVRLIHGIDNTISELTGIASDVTEKALDELMKKQLHVLYDHSLNLETVRVKLGNIINLFLEEAAPRTIGNDVFLRENWGYEVFNDKGKLTDAGRKLVMHEIAHVWQHKKYGGEYICQSAWSQLIASTFGENRNEAYDWQTPLSKAAAKGESLNFEDNLNPEQQANVLELLNWLLVSKISLDKPAPEGIRYKDPHTETEETINDKEREFLYRVYLDLKSGKL